MKVMKVTKAINAAMWGRYAFPREYDLATTLFAGGSGWLSICMVGGF
jgi:hypothetical protein